jgi:hypothetical protein
MIHLNFRQSLVVLFAVVALPTLASCSVVADEIAEEATQELASRVERRLESAASDTGRPTNDYELLKTALGAVVLVEAETETGSFRPRYAGLLDADGDGFDDDGQVEIVVRRDSTCIRAAGDDATVILGPCH